MYVITVRVNSPTTKHSSSESLRPSTQWATSRTDRGYYHGFLHGRPARGLVLLATRLWTQQSAFQSNCAAATFWIELNWGESASIGWTDGQVDEADVTASRCHWLLWPQVSLRTTRPAVQNPSKRSIPRMRRTTSPRVVKLGFGVIILITCYVK